MIRALLLTTALCCTAAGAQKTPPIQLASPGLQAAGIDRAKADFYSSHLAQQLSLQPDVRCMSSNEISSLLGLERQKQLLGCDTSANSCIAELANALGVDGLVTGSIALVGQTYQLNVRILSARDGAQLAVLSQTLQSEEAVLKAINAAGPRLAAQLRKSLGRADVVVESEPDAEQRGLRRWAWIPAVTGAVAAGVGGYFLYRSEDAGNRLTSAPGTDGRPNNPDEARALAEQGRQHQTFARVGLGVGAAALGTAAAFYLLGGEGPSASVSLSPDGPTVGFALSF